MDTHETTSPAARAARLLNEAGGRSNLPVPFPRSYWVAPGLLLAGAYPGDIQEEKCLAKIRGLAEHGVRSIFNLMEEVEYGHNGLPIAPYETAIEMRRFAIRDVSIPPVRLMQEILAGIDEEHAAGRPVYVHCWGGRGRTGTVIGCWLARHGIATGTDALLAIERLRAVVPDHHKPSPETEEQRAMVRGWRAIEAG